MRKTPIFVLAGFMAVFEALIIALAPHRIFADEAAMPVKERYRNVDRRQRPHVRFRAKKRQCSVFGNG
jgi:hypothetical protein